MLLCLSLSNMLLCLISVQYVTMSLFTNVTMSSEVAHEDVPYGNEVADAAGEDKEMEDGVHVATTAKGVEQRAGDIAHTLGDDPDDRRRTHRIDQGLESDEHTHAHTNVYQRLQIAVGLELMEARDRAHDGAEPYKAEQRPAPIALMAQGDERDGRIGTGDMPVDGRMIPLAQPLLPR